MKIVILDKMNEKFLGYAIGKQFINRIIINFDRKYDKFEGKHQH